MVHFEIKAVIPDVQNVCLQVRYMYTVVGKITFYIALKLYLGLNL